MTQPPAPGPEPSGDEPLMLPEAFLQLGPDGSTQPLQSQPPYGQAYDATRPSATPPYPTTPYGYGPPRQNHPSAQTAMVLGLVGLIGTFFCGLPVLLSPFAWAMGAKARREIDASNGVLGGRDAATAGLVTGIIGTVLLGLMLLAIALFVILVVVGS